MMLFMRSWNQIPLPQSPMESKQPVTIVERIQNSYREDPLPFWVLTAGTFIDRLGTNLIIPTSQALTALLTPLDMQARYVATEHFNWIIAQALSPLAAGTIMDRLDSRWVWYGCRSVRLAYGVSMDYIFMQGID